MSHSNDRRSETDTGAGLIADECIAVRLRMLHRVVTGIYDDALRPLGMTIGQLNILVTVKKLGNPSQKEVGEVLYMEKSTLSRNIDRLRQNGWLADDEKEGERARYLAITVSGHNLILQSLPLWEAAQESAREIIEPECEKGIRDAVNGLWSSPLKK